MSYLNVNDVRSEALFVSPLQPSEQPTADQVRAMIMSTIRVLGARGCAARMAQEYGNAPDSAVARMRWAKLTVDATFAVRPARTPVRTHVGAGRPAA